jgi:hypothetical protein
MSNKQAKVGDIVLIVGIDPTLPPAAQDPTFVGRVGEATKVMCECDVYSTIIGHQYIWSIEAKFPDGEIGYFTIREYIILKESGKPTKTDIPQFRPNYKKAVEC